MKLIAALICLLAASSVAAQPIRLAAFDTQVASEFPDTMLRIVTSIGRPDDQGLLGRNREWGGLYSVRFQYGAGRALRHGLATHDITLARLGRVAIATGLDSLEPSGAFPASLPDGVLEGVGPGISDQASAAAFFLSDVCPALLIAQTTEQETTLIRSAMGWLAQHQTTLIRRDQHAPNRLLITALAFGSCGQLLEDTVIKDMAAPFIALALEQTRPDGVFLEAGGTDTSYQAVNLVVGIEIVALDVAGIHHEDLNSALQRGGEWLSGRINPDGSLSSIGNTRTCADETFLGRPKDVDLREVFRSLAYLQATNSRLGKDLRNFETWLRGTPDPCSAER